MNQCKAPKSASAHHPQAHHHLHSHGHAAPQTQRQKLPGCVHRRQPGTPLQRLHPHHEGQRQRTAYADRVQQGGDGEVPQQSNTGTLLRFSAVAAKQAHVGRVLLEVRGPISKPHQPGRMAIRGIRGGLPPQSAIRNTLFSQSAHKSRATAASHGKRTCIVGGSQDAVQIGRALYYRGRSPGASTGPAALECRLPRA